MRHLPTKKELQEAIEAARKVQMTAEDVREQTISFILGTVGSNSKITRKQIEDELDRLPGQKSKIE